MFQFHLGIARWTVFSALMLLPLLTVVNLEAASQPNQQSAIAFRGGGGGGHWGGGGGGDRGDWNAGGDRAHSDQRNGNWTGAQGAYAEKQVQDRRYDNESQYYYSGDNDNSFYVYPNAYNDGDDSDGGDDW